MIYMEIMPVAVFVKTVDTIQKAQIAIDACQSSTDHVAKAGTKSMFANHAIVKIRIQPEIALKRPDSVSVAKSTKSPIVTGAVSDITVTQNVSLAIVSLMEQ